MNNFYFDELVLGGSLTALLYAYKKNLPILIDIAHVPFVLEEVPSHWDLAFLGFKRGAEIKKSGAEIKKLGTEIKKSGAEIKISEYQMKISKNQ